MTEFTRNRQRLMEEVGRRLESQRFKPVYSKQSFIRPFPVGRASFHLAFIRHPDDFDVVGDVAIRFDKLQDLATGWRTDISDKMKRDTYSHGAELGNIAGIGQKRWTVSTGEDVEIVADDIVKVFNSIGAPYLDRYSTLEQSYELHTGSEPTANYMPVRHVREINIVGLATLLGKENVRELASEYFKWLQDLNDAGLSQYKKFLDSIGIAI